MIRRLEAGYELDDDPSRIDVDAVHDYLANRSYWAEVRPRETVARLGLKIVYDRSYPPNTVDYTPIVRGIAAGAKREPNPAQMVSRGQDFPGVRSPNSIPRSAGWQQEWR